MIQIIKNTIRPICKECIYYKKQIFSSEKCTKYGTKNLVTGEIKYDTAEWCRKIETKCGANGKRFENIDPLATKYSISANLFGRLMKYSDQQKEQYLTK